MNAPVSATQERTGSAFQTAGIFGLVSASLCTVRNLERIASPRASRGGVGNERREKMIDFALCIALPLIYTALRMLNLFANPAYSCLSPVVFGRVYCCT